MIWDDSNSANNTSGWAVDALLARWNYTFSGGPIEDPGDLTHDRAPRIRPRPSLDGAVALPIPEGV